MFLRVFLSMLLVCAVLSGCSTNAVMRSHDTPQQFIQPVASTQESLFAGDAKTLSDAQIARILEFDYSPPPHSRLAILDFGRDLWRWWSADITTLADSMHDELTNDLQRSSRISNAAFLPSVLVPEKRTVPYLREAAARYQADLLLVYRSQCRSFQKFRFIRAAQSRAVCGVEAVLLDVRSGLVPVAVNASRSYETEKSTQDLNFQEAQMRAQLTAVQESLQEVATQVKQFLDEAR